MLCHKHNEGDFYDLGGLDAYAEETQPCLVAGVAFNAQGYEYEDEAGAEQEYGQPVIRDDINIYKDYFNKKWLFLQSF